MSEMESAGTPDSLALYFRENPPPPGRRRGWDTKREPTDPTMLTSWPAEDRANYAATRGAEADTLEALRRSPAVRALVTGRIRSKRQRTPDIPIRCGAAPVLYPVTALAFALGESGVDLLAERETLDGDRYHHRLTGPPSNGAEPLDFICRCDPSRGPVLMPVSTATLYRAALEALARGSQARRPVVQLHGLLRDA